MDKHSIKKILVYGDGIAAYQTVLALSNNLSPDIEIDFLVSSNPEDIDFFYGNTTSPAAYDFNLLMNLSEPELLLGTNTAFSFGTYYQHWARLPCSWMQCFHLPLPVEKGVAFHQLVKQCEEHSLGRYLVSAQAAKAGVFAHPPSENPNSALSRAEYGYQFCPREWASILASKVSTSRVNMITADIQEILHKNGEISSLHLVDGSTLTASLFIDCSGPKGTLLSALDVQFKSHRQLEAVLGEKHDANLGPPYQQLTSDKYGWQAETSLQNKTLRLTVFDKTTQKMALHAHGQNVTNKCSVKMGRRHQAWYGNCVAIGHAASVVEPLTPAPMMLLNLDIQRLLQLIPTSEKMHIEQREYNRRFHQDLDHAALFHDALFTLDKLPEGAYWAHATNGLSADKLHRKLTQFEHRGVLASFDLEPFNEQDWTILHFGMGRSIQNSDILIEQFSFDEIEKILFEKQIAINKLVQKMPSHHLYMEKLLQYLKGKHDRA